MGLTFQQKFYNIGDSVFLVHDRSHVGYCKVIAMVEVPDNKKEAEEIKNQLKRYGFVDEMDFDEVILKGYELLRK